MTALHLAPGAMAALAAALLFGASTPVAKLLVGEIQPWMLAAILYLGSGIGLLLIRLAVRGPRARSPEAASLAGRDWLWLGGAILFGGVIGPVLLMFGLAETPAATASLLLNLEGVTTAIIAWVLFRENVDRRIAGGMAAIVAGAAMLSWQGSATFLGLLGPLAIAGACLAWGIDNNLTRKVSLSDAVQIAMLKGLVAGAVNLVLALAQGLPLPTLPLALAAGFVGLLGYGLSLVLFVIALRSLGTARTGAYFSTAPFAGAVIGVVAVGEAITGALVVAGLLMAVGVWLHLTERHEHEHEHEPMEHTHRHRHDAHHWHAHGADDPPGEPHTHRHAHGRLRHVHPHYPDAHHRHSH